MLKNINYTILVWLFCALILTGVKAQNRIVFPGNSNDVHNSGSPLQANHNIQYAASNDNINFPSETRNDHDNRNFATNEERNREFIETATEINIARNPALSSTLRQNSDTYHLNNQQINTATGPPVTRKKTVVIEEETYRHDSDILDPKPDLVRKITITQEETYGGINQRNPEAHHENRDSDRFSSSSTRGSSERNPNIRDASDRERNDDSFSPSRQHSDSEEENRRDYRKDSNLHRETNRKNNPESSEDAENHNSDRNNRDTDSRDADNDTRRNNRNSNSRKNENDTTDSNCINCNQNKKHKPRSRRICDRKYAEYMNRIFTDEDDQADAEELDFDGRVLSAPGEYPHMTALGFKTTNNEVDYKCGGSLISENFVVTAAHCTNITGEKPTTVRIGDLDLMVEEERLKPQIRRIRRIYNHPEYYADSYYNDIALLELSKNVELTEFVRPIRLWVGHDIPHDTAFAMGYGATGFGKARTNRLTDLNMTIVSNEECNRQLPLLPETVRGIIDSQICAHDYAMNRDTCQGDSGGPLQLNIFGRRKRSRKHYHLIGITSYGLYCRSEYPSVYTRISSFLDWIEGIVWSH